jgi:hypothetical protein
VPRTAAFPVPHSTVRWRTNVTSSTSSPTRSEADSIPRGRGRVGLVVEDRASGFCGDVVRWNVEAVTLRDRSQHLRYFTWKPGGFLHEGRPVTLTPPAPVRPSRPAVTASGSIAGDGGRWPAAWRERAGSGWRDATTPSSSSTSGVTTCASSASWWSRCTAPTTSRHGAPSSARPGSAAGRPARPPRAGSKESRIAATVRHPAGIRRRRGRRSGPRSSSP